ncbi:MAG: hypothetical protein E7089_08910 [Bacteroidales bacterium]|nr:hypothetical protein [Bacteroidales bacterium]
MTTVCNNSALYDSLDFCQGTTVLPGIRKRVYFLPKSSIVKYPTLPDLSAEGVDMGALATYEGDFTLAADAKWKRIDVLTGDSDISSESQGDAPSKTFLNKCTLKHAGRNEEATGFCRMANSDDLVYLIQQRDGKYRVVGNEMFETNTKPAQASGAKETDTSGTTISVEVSDVCPAPFYVGKIVTDDGDIDASTGGLTT